MKKISYILIFMISILLTGKIFALTAFPNYLTTTHSGTLKVAFINGSLTTTENAQCLGTDAQYPCFLFKDSDQGNVLCISGLNVQAPGKDAGFRPEAIWNDTQKKAVAYIINTIAGNGGSPDLTVEQYYWMEILINDYLGTYDPSSHPGIAGSVNSNVLNTGKTYNQILSEAAAYSNADYSVNLSAPQNITFEKKGDGYYYATATISSNTSYTLSSITNSKFSYTKEGNTYTFKIKETDINVGGTEFFSITVANTGKEYYEASTFRHNVVGDPWYQDLTLSQTIKHTVPGKNSTISGSVKRDYISIKVAKVDSDKQFVSGAKLMFQTQEQKEKNLDGTLITSTDGYYEINNLVVGTYYLSELEAPEGYDKDQTIHEIVIAKDGTITLDGVVSETNTILVTNDLTETVISKINAVDSKELPGATLQILNSNKEKISCVILNEKGEKKLLEECTWVSGEKPVTVVGLAKGKYHLVETIAPEGYVLNESSVKFEIKADGKTTQVEMKNELYVEVPDTLSGRSALLITIAMIDIALGIGIITYVKKNKITQ